MTQPSRAPALLGLTLATAIWGSTFLVTKDSLDTMSVGNFLLWRFGIAAVILLVLAPRRWLRLSRRDVRRGLIIGVFLGSGFLAQTTGLQQTSAAVSGFLTGLMVVLTPIVAAILFQERIAARGWVAVVVATVGLALLALQGWALSPGAGLTILGALLFALQIASLSHWATPDNSYGLTTVAVVVAAAMALVAALVGGGVSPPAGTDDWVAVLYLAVGATCLGFVLQAWSQAHLSTVTAAVIMTLEPVFAGAIAVLIGGETLTARMWLGSSLIVAAMLVAELGPRAGKDARVPQMEAF